jgi:nucleoside-diphosphate-sugar epimerase
VADADSLAGTTVLITGATGFIGTHLANHLVARRATVVALVRPTTDLQRIPTGVTPTLYDGSPSGLAELLQRVRPDVAFHLAARFVAQHTADDIAGLVLDNVLFSAQLFDALAHSGCRRLVNVGTGWQHQVSAPSRPVNLYAATKQAVEGLLAFYTDSTCIRAVTLKLLDTYGPNDRRPKLFNILERASTSGQPLAMSRGEQLLDLVHDVGDVNALVVAAERAGSEGTEPSEVFSVPAMTRYTLREVVELYGSITGRHVQVVWGGRPYRDREVMIPWSGAALPGWQPRITLEDGLRTLGSDE